MIKLVDNRSIDHLEEKLPKCSTDSFFNVKIFCFLSLWTEYEGWKYKIDLLSTNLFLFNWLFWSEYGKKCRSVFHPSEERNQKLTFNKLTFFFKTDYQNEFNNKPVLNLYTSKVWEAADDSMRRRRAAAINLFIILNLRKVKANTWINSLYIFSLLSDGLCCWCCSTVHEADDVWQPLFL